MFPANVNYSLEIETNKHKKKQLKTYIQLKTACTIEDYFTTELSDSTCVVPIRRCTQYNSDPGKDF